jgi:dipeptidyl aminopeptidase/acylaminoacyl peptidase
MPEPTTHPLAAVPSTLFDDPVAEARWRARFGAVRIGLPDPARDAVDRTVLVSNESGVYELHTWDVVTGERVQATDRTDGTTSGVLSPDGRTLWWFDDADGDEFGSWRSQPFGVPAPTDEALPGVAPGYPAGLELGSAVVIAGFADDDGSRVHLASAAGTATVYTHAEDASVGALSRDETRWVLAHSEAGDSRYPDLRVYAVADGTVLAELSDGPGRGLTPQAFAPLPGDQRLLVGHERRGRDELLMWDTDSGVATEIELDLPGDLDADFYPDGSALLVSHTSTGRTTLHRYDLASGVLTDLPAAAGSIGGALARPDGAVWYRHSSAASAASVRVLTGDTDRVLLTPPGGSAPGSQPLTDLWVDGPGGPVHAFTTRPAGGSAGPLPTLFYVHGGPAAADDDSFDATRATWLDAGFAVVQVNYRGSTGYGSAWRDALTERIGHTELADIAAVHDRVVADGLADPRRCVLLGYSWGGFLTLLGIGTDPDRWAAAVAGAPIADYLAAYEDEMEPLRAYDRALFGGSPAEVPDKYRDSSPLTWLPRVRTPVLVSAGENDPRTPIRQVENYLDALARSGSRYEVYRYDAGHGSMVVAERMRQVAVEVDFVRRVLADLP